MIEIIVKSTISLGILYLVYTLVLSRLKTFKFNRFFLVGSLVFSLAIPFISIPVNNVVVPAPISNNYSSLSESVEFSGEFISSTESTFFNNQELLIVLYAIVSMILLTRFFTNLFNIYKQININPKELYAKFTFVLVKQNVLPHTFLRYVMLNADDHKNGRIDDTLIRHEIAHSRGLHTVDVLIIEILKVFCWFNPFIWLMKTPMQLNHEYLADHEVLSDHDYKSYKNTLINLVLRNNQGILISNFNFSLTKQRLKMMTKQFSKRKGIIGNISAVFIFLMVGFIISCNQEAIESDLLVDSNSISEDSDQWWQPILKKHNINPVTYNNFQFVFEMGTKNSINNGIATLENAFILLRPVKFENKQIYDDQYITLTAPFAIHKIEQDSILAKDGELRIYSLKDEKKDAVAVYEFSDIEVFVNDKKFFVNMNHVRRNVESKDGTILKEGEPIYNLSIRW